MNSDNDLIRRGDALEICTRFPYPEGISNAIAALPAVKVGVTEQVVQALAELSEVVTCRCHAVFRERGLQDPDCQCDSGDWRALQVVKEALYVAVLTPTAVADSQTADPVGKDVCEKCGGEGWLWAHELDNYHNPDNHSPMDDQTRYSCDGVAHVKPTLTEALAVPEVKALVDTASRVQVIHAEAVSFGAFRGTKFTTGLGLTMSDLRDVLASLRQIGGEE